MALDGGFIHNLISELQSAVGAHIDKIHQPSKNELVLFLRGFSGASHMIISCVPGKPRLHFTNSKFYNPDSPPMFCMLIRKHFGNARITGISAESLERVIKISVSSVNSMGDITYPYIMVELISSAPNIIAVNEDGTIMDAVHRTSLENDGRIILPGAVYAVPQSLKKMNPLVNPSLSILNAIASKGNTAVATALLQIIEGVSPLVCRELAYAAGIDCDEAVCSVTNQGFKSLGEQIELLKNYIENGIPYIVYDDSGRLIDVSFMNIKQYGNENSQKGNSFCSVLDEFYSSAAEADRIAKSVQEVKKTVSNLLARAVKRKNQRTVDLTKTENNEQKRIFGELLKANIYDISTGQTFAQVINYYDEKQTEVRIPLDPALSPAQNAAKYFKNYKKSLVATRLLSNLIRQDEDEIQYLESVLYSISELKTPDDVSGLKDELASAGYFKRRTQRKRKDPPFAPLQFISPSGFTVSVGKNNLQNDILTLKTAGKNDMWFHTKNIPGSHTIVFCGENELAEQDILFAAKLAAKYSKASDSSGVPVDYTRAKNVKKPAGSKPGMVIYSTNSTVFVTPGK